MFYGDFGDEEQQNHWPIPAENLAVSIKKPQITSLFFIFCYYKDMAGFYLFGFILGLAIGSFINCLVYRFYQKKTILGRSFCPQCGQKIAWYDNIPLLSFILLGGRCRHCQQKISWQYPTVELVTALLFLAVAVNDRTLIHNSLFFVPILRDWLMISALVFIFVYDFKYYLIEDWVIVPVAVAVLVLNLILGASVFNLLLAMILSAAFFLAQYFITRGKGIGLGDFRIGIMMGAYFGWPKIVIAIFSAYIIGAVVSFLLLLFKRKGLKSQVPLGPFLAAGSLLVIFFGQKILNWYLPLFQH